MSWTDERVEMLKKMWGEGQSASQIAKELGGVTRNAVIGKVHRLGLSNRATASATAKPEPKAKAAPRPQPAAKQVDAKPAKPAAEKKPAAHVSAAESQSPSHLQVIPAEKPLPPQPTANEISPEALASHREVQKKALRLSLMQLTEKTCKWPFGDPATDDFWFCGLPVEPGKCYCKPCAEIAYQPASARRDRRRS